MSHGPFGKRVERLPVAQGGTAASTPDEARKQLGVPSLTENNTFAGDQVIQGLLEADQLHANLSITTDGTVVIEEGTIDAALLTGSQAYQLPDKSGTFAMTSDIVGGIADGDYGDIVVSGSGTVMTVDPAATIEVASLLVESETGFGIHGNDVGIYAVFDASTLATESRTYALPDANGTLMLAEVTWPTSAVGISTELTADKTLWIFADDTENALTATLPDASALTAGKMFIIKNVGILTLTIATTSSQTIDGAAPGTLAQWDALTVVSNGSNWVII